MDRKSETKLEKLYILYYTIPLSPCSPTSFPSAICPWNERITMSQKNPWSQQADLDSWLAFLQVPVISDADQNGLNPDQEHLVRLNQDPMRT